MTINIKNILLYFIGITLMALSVVLMKETNIGLGSWDAVIVNLQEIIKIDIGYVSVIVNFFLVTFVIVYKRNFKYLLVFIPVIINMFVLNFWDTIVFKDFVLTTLFSRISVFALSTLLLPFGLSLIIISSLPKMIYDEVTFILMDIFKIKSFGVSRLGLEIFALILAMILGLIGSTIFNQIHVGTIIVTFSIGPLINLYLKLFKWQVPLEVEQTLEI